MKPKICEILGVKLREEFEFKTSDLTSHRCRVDEIKNELNIGIGYDVEEYCGSLQEWRIVESVDLIEMIEHPEKIIHEMWGNRDIENAKMVRELIPGACRVKRSKSGKEIQIYNCYGAELCVFRSAAQMFPSVKNNETVELRQIIGEE